MTKEYSSYLAHHGIKGQKWGVRRFQNEDGTRKDKKPESSNWKPDDAGSLSDEELTKRLTRLQKEKQYKDLTARKRDRLKKFLSKTAQTVLVATAVGALAGSMRANYGSFMKKAGEVTIDMVKARNGLRGLNNAKDLFKLGLKG